MGLSLPSVALATMSLVAIVAPAASVSASSFPASRVSCSSASCGSVSCSSVIVLQQDPAKAAKPEPQTLLSASQLKSLNKRARDWMKQYAAAKAATKEKTKAKAVKNENKSRDKFMKDWRKVNDKVDVLSSVPDLRKVFEECFAYDRFSGMSGQPTAFPNKDRSIEQKWDVFVPKKYTPKTAHRVVVQLPSYEGGDEGAYTPARDHFTETWGDSERTADTLFLMPEIDPDLDFDATPDFSRAGEDKADGDRLRAMFVPTGLSQRALNFDRSRMILDCGRGSSRFGMRIATYFPTRFAGVILRSPEEQGLRLENLSGIQVLLLVEKGADNQAYCERVTKELNELREGCCTLIISDGKYPFGVEKAKVSEWTAGVERNLFADQVVIAPNHDNYRKAFWVAMGTAEPLSSVAPEDRAYLKARVERETNTIHVDTKSVENFILSLNDDILDLDQDISVVINGGEPIKQKRTRSFSLLRTRIQRYFDPTRLFTVEWALAVPKPKDE